ncbi:MAG: MBL fold metallo-hydrolase [Planctomycetes bacterium]|nr:MBL fold metallo-hydrolase [Planctomycetota bacterium]
MKIRFWGVRGSLPTPGPETARYGGNTTCLQVVRDDGPIIILDSGTGIRALGDHLLSTGKPPFDIRLLITHTHWDHIHGFPFFSPMYIPGGRVEVYGVGPLREGKGFESVMRDQVTYSYFPFENTMLDNVVQYRDYNKMFPDGVERSFELCPGVKVRLKLTNHPVYCTAYRIEADGKSFVFSGDHEPWLSANPAAENPDTIALYAMMNDRFTEFCRGADLVVMDTTYTQAEYESTAKPQASKRGWGHSYFEYNIPLARKAGVKRMVFTHHDPTRTDAALDRLMQEKYLPLGQAEAPGVEFLAAREGMILDL